MLTEPRSKEAQSSLVPQLSLQVLQQQLLALPGPRGYVGVSGGAQVQPLEPPSFTLAG